MGEAHGRRAVGLLEVELDERPRPVVVPQPGERQPPRRVDLRVATAAAVLGPGGRVAHDDADLAADAQVDGGLGGYARAAAARSAGGGTRTPTACATGT